MVVNFRFYAIYHLFISAGLILLIAGYSWLLSISQSQLIITGLDNSFWIFINLCGIILTTSAFFIYSQKTTASVILTIPVSSVTRFITVFLYSVPLLFIITTCVYTITANCAGRIFISMNYLSEYSFNPFRLDSSISISTLIDHFQAYITIQSFALMIGSFFPKSGFIKTIGLCIVTLVIFSIISTFVMTDSFGSNFTLNYINILFTNDYQSHELLKQIPIISFIWQSVIILVIPFCWFISYSRIKEFEA